MNVYYASDIHLEIGTRVIFKDSTAQNNFNSLPDFKNQEWLQTILKNTTPKLDSILILAGDTFFYHPNFFLNNVLNELFAKFKEVYIIAGNHEFYHPKTDIAVLENPVKKKIADNAWFINNDKLWINNHKLLFTPLFSHIKEHEQFSATRINDFNYIQFNGELYKYTHHNHLHQICVDFLNEELKENVPTTIVSHHLPSYQLISNQYKGSSLNPAFAAEMTDMIFDNPNIKHWIYGHSHFDNEIKINQTQMLSNQMGYYSESRTTEFGFNKYFEI